MFKQPSVVYVEDDADSREVMQLVLVDIMQLRHVTILENSAEFMSQVQALTPQPDLVLLDIHVRPYDGFQMLDMLRAQPEFAQVPVVALTASVMSEEIQLLKDAGFDSVIAKPVDMDILPELLERVLRGEHLWRIIQ
jgi:CheY-like chemotaxis protein